MSDTYQTDTPRALNAEQAEIIGEFAHLLRGPTEDGGVKRERKEKPLWKVDDAHTAAMYRHLKRWESGEKVDPDSGSHPLVHVAWRALAIAWQEGLRRLQARSGDGLGAVAAVAWCVRCEDDQFGCPECRAWSIQRAALPQCWNCEDLDGLFVVSRNRYACRFCRDISR